MQVVVVDPPQLILCREDRMSLSPRAMARDEPLHPIQSLILSAGPGRLAMLQRYIGHCNVQTDIKEAVFLGEDDQYVATGAVLAWLVLLSSPFTTEWWCSCVLVKPDRTVEVMHC